MAPLLQVSAAQNVVSRKNSIPHSRRNGRIRICSQSIFVTTLFVPVVYPRRPFTIAPREAAAVHDSMPVTARETSHRIFWPVTGLPSQSFAAIGEPSRHSAGPAEPSPFRYVLLAPQDANRGVDGPVGYWREHQPALSASAPMKKATRASMIFWRPSRRNRRAVALENPFFRHLRHAPGHFFGRATWRRAANFQVTQRRLAWWWRNRCSHSH